MLAALQAYCLFKHQFIGDDSSKVKKQREAVSVDKSTLYYYFDMSTTNYVHVLGGVWQWVCWGWGCVGVGCVCVGVGVGLGKLFVKLCIIIV